jgi:hypothetical protein
MGCRKESANINVEEWEWACPDATGKLGNPLFLFFLDFLSYSVGTGMYRDR